MKTTLRNIAIGTLIGGLALASTAISVEAFGGQ